MCCCLTSRWHMWTSHRVISYYRVTSNSVSKELTVHAEPTLNLSFNGNCVDHVTRLHKITLNNFYPELKYVHVCILAVHDSTHRTVYLFVLNLPQRTFSVTVVSSPSLSVGSAEGKRGRDVAIKQILIIATFQKRCGFTPNALVRRSGPQCRRGLGYEARIGLQERRQRA